MDGSDKQKRKNKQGIWKLINPKWIITITIVSMCLSMMMSYASSEVLASVNNIAAFFILLIFILLGIVFDIIGIAATSATEKEFHSMAAKKVTGAKEAVWLTRNAEKVSSFCNDVVGDISGIMSGATSALIVSHIVGTATGAFAVVLPLVITGLVAAMTIGGKAAGKAIGIGFNGKILFGVGKLLSLLPISLDKKK